MTVYIAGPMTGIPEYNRPAFAKAQAVLENAGYTVLNPAVLPDKLPGTAYMPICLAMVQAADAVVLLHGWIDSLGTEIERRFALYQGKPVVSTDGLMWGEIEEEQILRDLMRIIKEAKHDGREGAL